MLSFLDGLRDMTALSVALRMLLAVVCGGLVGMEREFKRRPAGFRTHILICLGATMTTLTSQYLLLEMHYYTDIARLGAQVIAGIGFIGAGCIIVTRRRRVKGLTTAAGMWTAAIVGLAIGAGYYEGGLLATVLILIIEVIFDRFERIALRRVPEINLYVEYAGKSSLEGLMRFFHEEDVTVNDLEISRASESGANTSCVILSLQLKHHADADELISELQRQNGILFVEEL